MGPLRIICWRVWGAAEDRKAGSRSRPWGVTSRKKCRAWRRRPARRGHKPPGASRRAVGGRSRWPPCAVRPDGAGVPQFVAPAAVVLPEPVREDPRLPCPACGQVLEAEAERGGQGVALPGLPCDAQSCGRPAAGDGQAAACGPVPRPAPEKNIAVDLGGGVKLEMILIPAGEFLMGSPDAEKDAYQDEKPQHRVRITKPFYLGKYAVTQDQWEAVMGSNPSHFKGPQNPVEQVSWEDCQEFLRS